MADMKMDSSSEKAQGVGNPEERSAKPLNFFELVVPFLKGQLEGILEKGNGAPETESLGGVEKQNVGNQLTKTSQINFILCSVFVVSFIFWANLNYLDVVSMAKGEVAPASQLKTVQHLEGGIIKDIKVREGQRISAGQAIVVLAPTAMDADLSELQVRLSALEADIIRAEAIVSEKTELDFPEGFRREYPGLVSQAERRLRSRRELISDELRKQQATINQRKQEIQEIRTRRENNRRALKLVNEQLSIIEELMKDDLTNRFEHLDKLKEQQELQGSFALDKEALKSAEAAMVQANAELAAIKSRFRDENEREFDEVRREFAELSQRLNKFKDSVDRTIVRSPVDGVVKVMYVATTGGVLRPGDPVADIVPLDDHLIINAELPIQDIGYVEVDQPAIIKLTSADAMRYGNLNGKVSRISPDALEDKEGRPYYKVRIETERSFFERQGLRYNLYPGMEVAVTIKTGQRTVMQYLTDPLRAGASDAMQER